MDKLVFETRRAPKRKTRDSSIVRISADDFDYLDELRHQTGLPMNALIAKFIEFGKEHIELR